MTVMPGPAESYRYHLKFYFRDRRDPFIYPVDKGTAERVRRNLNGVPDTFCCFSTLDGREVGVCLNQLDLVNFLWEPAVLAPTPEHEEDGYPVTLYFVGREEPYVCDPDEAQEVHDLFFYLELGSYDHEPFLAVTDEDGERVVLDARRLLLVEADAATVREGENEIEQELEEVPPPLKSRRKRRSPKASE